jgi:hypothetical protein
MFEFVIPTNANIHLLAKNLGDRGENVDRSNRPGHLPFSLPGFPGHFKTTKNGQQWVPRFQFTTSGNVLGWANSLDQFLSERERIVEQLTAFLYGSGTPGTTLAIGEPRIVTSGLEDYKRILDGYFYYRGQGPLLRANYRKGHSRFYTSASMSTVLGLVTELWAPTEQERPQCRTKDNS